jgi:hypothetical protein
MLAEREITAFAEKMRRALAGADEFPEQWARLQRRWAGYNQEQPHYCGAELQEAYEEATGTLVVCD